MLRLVLTCGECDRKLEGDPDRPEELREKARKLGWKDYRHFSHICPHCIAANATDAELAHTYHVPMETS